MSIRLTSKLHFIACVSTMKGTVVNESWMQSLEPTDGVWDQSVPVLSQGINISINTKFNL